MILLVKFHLYKGLDDEVVHKEVTHVIVAKGVTTIKKEAFLECERLVSVIMDDSVKVIEEMAFTCCFSLAFVRLSRRLTSIGGMAFHCCESLESLFLPATVRKIGLLAIAGCTSLKRLSVQPTIADAEIGVGLLYCCEMLLHNAGAGVQYELRGDAPTSPDSLLIRLPTSRSSLRVNSWLINRNTTDLSPLHAICQDPYTSGERITKCLQQHGKDSALLQKDENDTNALHVLCMNPYASSEAFLACHYPNRNAAIVRDAFGMNAFDYAERYNAAGLFALISDLCMH